MSSELKPHLHLEVGHILFLDIVGFSKLLADEQKELVQELNQIVRETKQFQAAQAEGKLTRLPTGDGMVLVFTNNPEAPVECALEISQKLQSRPQLKLRMGIHSGPVNPVADVNDQANLAGAGINVAQRVMSCGDAGHILLSKHFAEDLEHYAHWRSHLHNVGEVKVKHGAKIRLVNLYTDQLGNSALPEKLRQAKAAFRVKSAAIAALLLIAALGVGFWMLRRSQGRFESAVGSIPYKSIAVLPFENLSEEKQNAFFAEGMQDEVLSDLAKVADLKVISRTSVMLYKAGNPRNLREIGQQLGVAHVLEGNVQRAGGKVRVNAQLVDTRTDKHLWAQTYDRDLADVFAIQSEIAQSIASELQAKISASEKAAIDEQPTKDLAAYDLHVRATVLINKAAYEGGEEQRKNYLQAVDLLNQAVARDPGFLFAYCRLAEAHDALYFQVFDRTPNRLALAKAAIDSAFRLKPDSGEAHLALARHLYNGYFDYDRARDELAIALRTLPNNAQIFEWSGLIDRRQGRWRDAVRNLERAIELDPRNRRILLDAYMTYHVQRDYRQAGAIIDRFIALDPNNMSRPRHWRAYEDAWARVDIGALRALLEKGMDDPAFLRDRATETFFLSLFLRNPVAADRALGAVTGNTVSPRGGPVIFNRAYAEGLVAQMKGDSGAARAAFNAARTEQDKVVRAQPDDDAESGHLCFLGLIDAALGRKQEALSEGRRAVELVPVTKDAVNGPDILYFYAAICAQVGERDLAIEQLKTLAKIPVGAEYGELRLDPFWDPLRGDPRFEQIVASLAPKQ